MFDKIKFLLYNITQKKDVILCACGKIYKIYTDASFDNQTKLATYAIVIQQKNKTIKSFGKKCRVNLENSIECEVFAIFQAMNIIISNLLKKDEHQEFLLQTDCEGARDFFYKNKEINIFKKNPELYNKIKQTNAKIKTKLSGDNYNFKINLIPRNKNNIAHSYSYKTFKSLKKVPNKNKIEDICINKKFFLDLIQGSNSKKCKVIMYLSKISDREDLILRTQKEIASLLNMPISTVNKIFRELVELKILNKITNGIYSFNL